MLYDKKTSGACKQMGYARCPAVSAEWAPDGRHFFAATTSPRLRVDNNVKVMVIYWCLLPLILLYSSLPNVRRRDPPPDPPATDIWLTLYENSDCIRS